jgi:hypothetical protein
MSAGDIVAITLGTLLFFAALVVFVGVFSALRLSGTISEQEEREAARELVDCGGEAPPVAVYGRPQHIPEEVMANIRKGWDEATEAEQIKDLLRGVPS